MKAAVVTFPGSNCDYDCLKAVEQVGAEALFVWHRPLEIGDVDLVVLPGGFSYGDYIRCGAVARFSPVMNEVVRFAETGRPVLPRRFGGYSGPAIRPIALAKVDEIVTRSGVPVVAVGGIADGRTMAGALTLGAEGVMMASRFIATKEAPVHQNVKDALVAASELDTRLIMRPIRNTERVLSNPAVDKIVEIEKEKGASLEIGDIIELVAGVYPKVMQDGEGEDPIDVLPERDCKFRLKHLWPRGISEVQNVEGKSWILNLGPGDFQQQGARINPDITSRWIAVEPLERKLAVTAAEIQDPGFRRKVL